MKSIVLVFIVSCLTVVAAKFYRNSGPRGPLERFRVLISYRDQPTKEAQLRAFEESPLLSRLTRFEDSPEEKDSSEIDVPRARVAMKFHPYHWAPPL